jgi:geranylgeranyl diphosphate synthase type II
MDKERVSHVKEILNSYRLAFEKYMDESLPVRKNGVPQKLHECMEYSLNAGGKRLRPVLCLAAAERCGCNVLDALPMALGLEMLHTATLIHDDLPCMDNDDMRRGKPSNHAKYGETMAVLAGDALLAQSVEYPLIHTKNVPSGKLLKAMQIFSSAIGPAGVCGGQAMDVDPEAASGDPDYVRKTAALKTGALIRAAVLAGAALGTDNEEILDCYYNYGTHLGSAFQIVDDILDVTSTVQELGKTPGKDAEQDKITHVTAYGLETALKLAEEESSLAKKALSGILPENDFLTELPDYLVHRTH